MNHQSVNNILSALVVIVFMVLCSLIVRATGYNPYVYAIGFMVGLVTGFVVDVVLDISEDKTDNG